VFWLSLLDYRHHPEDSYVLGHQLGWEAAIPLAEAVYQFGLFQFPGLGYPSPVTVDAAANVLKSPDVSGKGAGTADTASIQCWTISIAKANGI